MSGPTSLLNTITLPEFTDLLERNFVAVQNTVKPVAQQMFITDDMSEHTGNSRIYNEWDTQQYASIKLEGQNASKALAGVGYNKTLYAKRIAKEIDITWEMRRYTKYPEITGKMDSLTNYCPLRIDIDLTHRITFATVTSYVDMDGITVDVTGGDGLSVANAAHTLAFSPTTWSNLVPGAPAISRAGLEAAEILANTNILSNFGDKRVMDFNVIFSTDDPSTVNNIQELLRSTASPSAPNSGVENVYAAKYRHVVLKNLATTATGATDTTKRRWWGLAAVGQGVNGWQAYFGQFEIPHLITPAVGNNGEDVHNDNWTFGTRASYGIAVVSGRGFILSNPVS